MKKECTYNKKVFLRKGDEEACLYCPDEIDHVKRPAMVLVPGGGYSAVCIDPEGFNMAEVFSKRSFRCFILNYRVSPHTYPAPQQDLARAIRLIRHNADEWGVIKDNVAVCGCSAGGHLCVSLGTIFDEIPPENIDDADKESCRPDAVIACYSVVSSGKFAHHDSFRKLLGNDYEAKKNHFSLENRVTEKSSPMFIWTVFGDTTVPYQNSVLLAGALAAKNVKSELHVFQGGYHGMASGHGRADVALWPETACVFMRSQLGFRIPQEEKKRVFLLFDDSDENLSCKIKPILEQYGFSASFVKHDQWKSLREKLSLSIYIIDPDEPWVFGQAAGMVNGVRRITLTYIDLSEKMRSDDGNTLESFKGQMQYLKDNGFEAVSPC